MKKFLLGIMALFAMSGIAFGEDVPIFTEVKHVAYVEFDKAKNVYKYFFCISNPETNTGEISNIHVDISANIDSQKLSSEGLTINRGTNRKGVTLTEKFDDVLSRMSSLMQKQVVPTGSEPPLGWSSGISVIGTLSWGSKESKYRIKPGQTLNGYTMSSRGIPAIREISVRPKYVLVVDDVSEQDLEKSKKTEEELTLHGKTIGPTAPPADFNSTAFLDSIIDLKHQAVSLGWIKNEGAVTSLDAKLDNAKKKISEGQTGAAKNILNAFINEVEAQGCATYESCPSEKHLTSEAYALLKYNAQYLIDNLK